MKRFLVLALAALSIGAPGALAQDSLLAGDIAVFSAFRARIDSAAARNRRDPTPQHRECHGQLGLA